eukprot:SM000008S22177  [mRNA]  locus=s8:226750:241282:- [translate_table: standard]
MDYETFLVRLPGYARPTRGSSRILKVTEHGIYITTLATINPTATQYSFDMVTNLRFANQDRCEFSFETFALSSGGKEVHTFLSSARSELLTTLHNKLDDLNGIGTDFHLKKHSHRREGFVDAVMRVRSTSIVKMEAAGARLERQLANPKKINLQDILQVEILGDDGRIVLLHFKSRVLRLSLRDSLAFALAVQRNMKLYLNRDIQLAKTSAAAMVDTVSSRQSILRDRSILYEFAALKGFEEAGELRERTLYLTSHNLIEKGADEIICDHSLSDILGVVISATKSTEVLLEFRSWRPTRYFVQDRDSFMASISNIMGLSKGLQFSIHMDPFGPHTFPDKPLPLYQNECEAFYLSRIMTSYNTARDPLQWLPMMKEYVCNMHLGDSLCIDPRPMFAVSEILRGSLTKQGEQPSHAVTCCLVLQRFLASRPCFDAVRGNPDFTATLLLAMKSENPVVAYVASMTARMALKLFATDSTAVDSGLGAVSSAALALLGTTTPAASEIANKHAVLSPENLKQFVALLHTFAPVAANALQVQVISVLTDLVLGVLDVFTLALNLPSNETDADRTWTKAREASLMLAADTLCSICRSQVPIVFRSNAILLKRILEVTSPNVAGHFQKTSLAQCVVLLHLRTAVFSESRSLLAWLETLEILRVETVATPVLVWNDIKRADLQKFLREEVSSFDAAIAANAGLELHYNSGDALLEYSALGEGGGTRIGGLNLELLVEGSPPTSGFWQQHWKVEFPSLFVLNANSRVSTLYGGTVKLQEPALLFQSVFQALLLAFTPLYGTCGLPEVDPRLAVHLLSWIYERYPEELSTTMETLKTVESMVSMLREALENDHHVFTFKALVFLVAAMDLGGRDNVLHLIRAGGLTVIIPMLVLSLATLCKDVTTFECDTASFKGQGPETVPVMGSDGQIRMARVPCGKETNQKAALGSADSAVDAREAIRWQDDEVPEKLQLGMALDLLEALLRLSGAEDSVKQFPPSAVCLDLCREEILFHIVQLLLRAKSPVFGRLLAVVSHISTANRAATPGMYKFGLFEILVWKLVAGDLAERDRSAIVKFFSQSHLLQHADSLAQAPTKGIIHVDHLPWHESILQLYFPPGIIVKLISEGPEVMKDIIDSDVQDPEVIWNNEMKALLVEHVTTSLEPYVKARASDPQAVYIYSSRSPVSYPELADAIFVAPVYLHHLLDIEAFPSHHINDVSSFHKAIMTELLRIIGGGDVPSTWRKEVARVVALLHAQALVQERYPEIHLPEDADTVVISAATPALRVCIAQREDCPDLMANILSYAARILRNTYFAERRSLAQPVLNFALGVLSLGTKAAKEGTAYPEVCGSPALEAAVADALGVLELASASAEGRTLLRDDVRWRKGCWWAMCSAAGPSRAPSPVTLAALNCLDYFCGDSQFCYRVLKQALLLPILLLSIPDEAGQLVEETDKESESGDGVSVEELLKAKNVLQLAAAKMLQSLACQLAQPLEEESPDLSPEEVAIVSSGDLLSNILPYALLGALVDPKKGPSLFVEMAVMTLRQPTAIWNLDVRLELREKVALRIPQASNSENELQWLASYDAFKDEFILGGIFVRVYIGPEWRHSELPNMSIFLDNLQDYLSSKKDLIGSSVQEDKSMSVEERSETFTMALLALRQCLEWAVEGNGREPLLRRVRFPLLEELLREPQSSASVRQLLIGTFRALACNATSQQALLSSGILCTLGFQLWKGLAGSQSADEGEAKMPVIILEMLLCVSQEIPSKAAAADEFAVTSGLLLPLLTLFCKCPLPSTNPQTQSSECSLIPEPLREAAARIIGQILLATVGVSKEEKPLRDLQQHRGAEGSNIHSRMAAADVTDLYEISHLLSPVSASSPISQERERQMPLAVTTLLLCLPVNILSAIAQDPSRAGELYDSDLVSPCLVWDQGTRAQVTKALTAANTVVQTLSGQLQPWSLEDAERPLFLRQVLVEVALDEEEAAKEMRPTYVSSGAEPQNGYAWELYLGGYYLDQFLRDPSYQFPRAGFAGDERLLRELRKTMVAASSSGEEGGGRWTFDDRRRLLLALLLLFRARPKLLQAKRAASIDVFLPAYDFIAGSRPEERRGLAQAAILLLQCAASHPEVAEAAVTDELITALLPFLALAPPSDAEGFPGTDPQLCCLVLLLRLLRYSSKAVSVGLRQGMVIELAKIVTEAKGGAAAREKAAKALALMCSDKKSGAEVSAQLDERVPAPQRKSWSQLAERVEDDVGVDTLAHLARHRFPTPWWDGKVPAYVPPVDPVVGVNGSKVSAGPREPESEGNGSTGYESP